MRTFQNKMNIMKNARILSIIAGGSILLASCQEADNYGDALLMTGTSTDPLVTFAIDELPSSYLVSVTSTARATNDIDIQVAVDTNLVASYNAAMGTNYYPVPDGAWEISTENVNIPQGQAISSAAEVTVINDADFVPGRVYIIPVTIKNADFPVIEANRTIYLKVSRTLHFAAPYTGNAQMAYQFLLPDPIQSLPVYTWEVKILAERFRDSGASGTTRVCSFGGDATSVEGGAIDDGGFKCDQNLLRFGEGTDAPNILKVTTKQGSMSSNTVFAVNRWYSVALVNDGSTLTLYIDGEKDNSITVSPYEYTLYGVQIGMPSAGYQSSQLFYGRLSEMRLWTRALSAREIRANTCGVDPSTNGLVSYWRMNEGEGSTFYDLSPNKRDIAYTNGVEISWTNDEYNTCVE